ncbi:hypothetical protein [Foetidibacter luteolus]|uniref:hypothetical protein n=1 Tax=Foetidibacter luteolus TaxID=2608880 RepID=UPI00129B2EB3|nr:hypothetical protein [Foetidibacter luteolus]
MRHTIITVWFGLCFILTQAQNYHAVNGSLHSGSLGVHNNPASIVNSPLKWDMALFGVQVKSATNAVTLHNFSVLKFTDTVKYSFKDGDFSRKLLLNDNVNLFNTRIAINKRNSIAFGLNIKNYAWINTGPYNYIDTVETLYGFLSLNQTNREFTANLVQSAWVEIYGAYARTIFDNETGRLNAGITAKISRGASGAYGRLTGGRFANAGQDYNITGGALQYGYSSNYDRWDENNSTGTNLSNFLRGTERGYAIDLGLEYLVKPLEVTDIYDEDNYYDYDWKIGLSVLDIGANSYRYGRYSQFAAGVKSGVTSAMAEAKFDTAINSLKDFNDSLATIVNETRALRGRFRVLNPTRLVLNIDRFIHKNFYINAELSLSMPSSALEDYLHVRDLNLLTITPRWENRKFGFYLPIHYNNQQQFWVGGAVKAGPVLFGLHNWGYLFTQSSMQNGGGYISVIIKSPQNSEHGKNRSPWDCPP